MKTFRILIDGEFEAESSQRAFELLSKHFANCAAEFDSDGDDVEDDQLFLPDSYVKVAPADDESWND